MFVFACLRGDILRGDVGIFAGNYLNTSGLDENPEFRCILFVFSCLRGDTLRGKASIFAGNFLNTSGLDENLDFRCMMDFDTSGLL